MHLPGKSRAENFTVKSLISVSYISLATTSVDSIIDVEPSDLTHPKTENMSVRWLEGEDDLRDIAGDHRGDLVFTIEALKPDVKLTGSPKLEPSQQCSGRTSKFRS